MQSVIHHRQLIQFQHCLHTQPTAAQRILKLWSLFSMCHRLIRRSSADRYVAPSLFTEIELMWYVCALANTRRGLASTISSIGLNTGTRSDVIDEGSTGEPNSSRRLKPSVRFRRSETFHSFTVLSAVLANVQNYITIIMYNNSNTQLHFVYFKSFKEQSGLGSYSKGLFVQQPAVEYNKCTQRSLG